MKDVFSRLSPAGTQHSLSITPEDRTTEWWRIFNYVSGVKSETGQWPSNKDADCRRWMLQTSGAFRAMKNRGHMSQSGNRVLTEERLIELRRIGFPQDGTVPTTTLDREGPLERIKLAISTGKKPARGDLDVIRRRKLDMPTYEYLVKHGVKL